MAMKTAFVTFSFLLVMASASATTYVSDGSVANTQSIHDNLAQDGDIIHIPSGTFTWSSQLTITKAITLEGEDTGDAINTPIVDHTVIRDANSDPNRLI